MGRRKIEMAKITNKDYLITTFSKRKKGLLHKASEFCMLSGAEIAILVFSPGDRVFRFGHPSADSIIDRYAADNISNGTREFPYTIDDEDDDDADGDDLGSELGKEAAVGKGKVGEEARFLWDNVPIEDMGLKQLEQYKRCLEVVRNKLAYEIHETRRRESHTRDFFSLIGSSTSTGTSTSADPVRGRHYDIVEEHKAPIPWSSYFTQFKESDEFNF